MNNIKKIGLLLLVLGVITGFTQAAKEEKPDATIRLSGGGGRSRDRLQLGERDADLQGEGLSNLREGPLVRQSRDHERDRFRGRLPSEEA